MKATMSAGFAGSLLLLCAHATIAAEPAASAAAADCKASGNVTYICGPRNAEDLVAVPGTTWIIASGMAPNTQGGGGAASGELYLFNSRDRSFRAIGAASLAAPKKDEAMYAKCPGPPQAATFGPHGLALRAGEGGRHTLYIVAHGSRESIEVFEVDASAGAPKLTWTGCAVLEDKKAWLNSVAPLPDGGLVVSSMYDPSDGGGFMKLADGAKSGAVYEWQPRTGFKRIPGSELSGDNGIEVSADGKWLFVNAWSGQSVVRMSRTGTDRQETPVKFMPDNMRKAADGSILVTGQNTSMKEVVACQGKTCPIPGTTVLRLDPASMRLTEVLNLPSNDVFANGTTALQVGNTLWIGTFRGDRLAVVPLKN